MSRTDAGESKTHQAGILIGIKDGRQIFPKGTGLYQCVDDRGNRWKIRFKDRAKASESRITHLTVWLRRFSVKGGDEVILSALPDGSYRLSHIPKGTKPKESAESLRGFPEGAKIRTEVNRYERSKDNREAAIAFHGIACLACNVRMADIYGKIADRFIHIHHTKSLSQTGKYTPDIETDLIPLCPNCHSVVHLTDPPMTLEELKRIIEEASHK